MVFSLLRLCWDKKSTMGIKVPPLLAILIAMAMCQCNKEWIAWCSMSRATLEATSCHHWATTHSVLPWWPPGQQQTKQRWKKAPTLVAVLMALAVSRYNTTCIAWWRRFMAFLEATGCHHWASIHYNSIDRMCQCQFFVLFFIVNMLKTGAKQTIGVWHIKLMGSI